MIHFNQMIHNYHKFHHIIYIYFTYSKIILITYNSLIKCFSGHIYKCLLIYYERVINIINLPEGKLKLKLLTL